jgi:hypothetical protein
MKSARLTFVISFISLLFFSSCKKEPVARVLTHGTWKVTVFSENGIDETFQFLGYEFIFHGNETVEAIRGNSKIRGSWSTAGEYDNNDLFLNFGDAAPLNELNEIWQVLENRPAQVRLAHATGGNGGTDMLTLERQ